MIESAWQALLHPWHAYKEIVSLRRDADSLRSELQRMGEERSDLLGSLKESREVQDDFERLRLSMEGEVRELKRVNAEQEQRLRDWENASEEMERVAGQLEKMVGMRERMNEMRRDYEARIEKLERQLWSTRSGGLQYAQPSQRQIDPSESELLEPGEDPFSPPLPIQMAPRRPKISPAEDDSDWLLSLPPG